MDFDTIIVFATTASKAKWIAVRGWREAGYGSGLRWPTTLTVSRADIYDNHPNKNRPPVAYNELYMLKRGVTC